MSERLSAYIVEADAELSRRLRAALGAAGFDVLGVSFTAAHALGVVLSTCPDVILLDVGTTAGADPVEIVRRIATSCPRAHVIVTGAGSAGLTLSRAVAAGAHSFVLKPYRVEDVLITLREALATQVQAPAAPPPPRPAERGKLIAVYSPKGGVGCTTVATNLAVALAARGKLRVALVDLDLQWGDVGAALDLRGANSIAELVGHETISEELVSETFVRHSSGVMTLPAPDDLATLDEIDPEHVVRVLEQLRRHFDFTICDMWSSFEELTRGVLRVVDRVILVTTPELPALRSTQRLLTITHNDLHLEEKAFIVANRSPGKAGLSGEEIAKIFGRTFSASIPSEGIGVTDAINRGLSLLDPRIQSKVATHYRKLADALVRPPDVRAPRPAVATQTR
jgi:pilus assembly protein CpaE